MAIVFHAIALDLDGTLTVDGRLCGEALSAIGRVRSHGVRALLVTGRTLAHLDQDFAGLRNQFDAVVAENGAVVASSTGNRLLAAPVDPVLADALARRGVGYRRGQVLLDCARQDDLAALEETSRLGLDYQLVHNRGALMILPAGVSKGQGLLSALDELGLSAHNTVGVGDAENDHSLLETCELAVAVGNAVPALKAHADLVLDGPNGTTLADFLTGPVLAVGHRTLSRRRQVALGSYQDGSPALVPAAQVNILVAGGTGRGKSYVAGLLAERLIDLGYRLVVIDPEGDHVGLGRMRDTFVLGGRHDPLPRVDEVIRLLRYGACSLVLDLSTSPATDRERYISQLTARLDALRTERGLPHWVVLDEAHLFLRRHGLLRPVFDPTLGGYCLVTYRPDDLSPEVVAAVDVIVSTTTPVDTVIGPHCLTPLPCGRPLSAQLLWPNRPDPARTFTLSDRGTPHTRHRRKYAEAVLPSERRFHFRTPSGGIYTEASTLTEFEEELARCDPTTVGHHLLQRDFSRWVVDVLQDPSLGSAIATIERDVTDRYQADLQRARARIRKAIERRYLTHSPSHGAGRR